MEKRTILLIVSAVVALFIFFQNLRFVDLTIIFFTVRLPLIVLLIAVFALGMFANKLFSR